MANPTSSSSIAAGAAVIILLQLHLLHAQQIYINNKQLNCSNTQNYTLGYACNGVQTSCQSYLTFLSAPPNYSSIPSIAYLLNSQPAAMATLNELTDVATIPALTPILVPVTCSCAGLYYQYNASYVLKFSGETYFTVANDTYQGLTTCQALIAENPYNATDLHVGNNLTVPLRCACPSAAQTATGVKYLVTYSISKGDTIDIIAGYFGVSRQSVLDANELSETSVIYPYNSILVPLTTGPTKIVVPVPAPPPASPPQTPVPTTSSSSKKWVFVGVGIGVGVIGVLLVAVAVWFFLYRSRSGDDGAKTSLPVGSVPPKKVAESVDYTPVPLNSSSWSISTEGLREAIETLTVYKFEDLQIATGSFSEDNRIKGSVFRAKFKGDDAAVKILKGDVSGEINILRKINHTNIIRLSGFCVHQGNTYLVYEYAENGSLSDWIHSPSSSALSWKQRVQVAYGVADAINYLHNYTNPPYIHKNLKSSNVLLDGNFRAKIANFGLARTVENDDDGLQMTRHVVGTQGYMAPEYIENGVITPKLDVFAFGVVVLEILSGKEAAGTNKNREELLSTTINRVLEGDNVKDKLRGFIDSALKDEYPLDLAFSMAELAKRCVAYDLNSRPAISEVLMTLSKISSSSSDWDPSDELDSSRSMSHSR